MKFERSWIIKASKGAKTLKDVYQNVLSLKGKARKDSLSESVYTVLEEYLKIVIPQIEKFTFTTVLDLGDGINVMDLTLMSLEMRSLVIRSVMEEVSDHLSNVIIIVPEAWEYIPQGRSTPVKWYAESFIRKGASVGNYLFVDSQDIAGIDKTPLRQCDNWIMGRQRELHEIDRLRDTIGKTFASDEDIRQLPLGTFFASIGDDLKKVYILPAGVEENMGIQVAKGELSPDAVKNLLTSKSKEGNDEMYKEKYEQEVKVNKDLSMDNQKLKEQMDKNEKNTSKLLKLVDQLTEEKAKLEEDMKGKDKDTSDRIEQLEKELESFNKLKEALCVLVPQTAQAPTSQAKGNIGEVVLTVEQPVLTVNVQKKVVAVNTSNAQGRVALLYSEGYFDGKERSISDIQKEMISRGWSKDPRLSGFLDQLCTWGYLKKRKTDRWFYVAVTTSTDAEKQGILKKTDTRIE